jgi:hypothetical protein
MPRLSDSGYLAYPFRIGHDGARTSGRSAHVREQIEQVLFTNPAERVFRPEFGAGIKTLIFEPNSSALWEVARNRLLASLVEALQGEVDPKTLSVNVFGEGEMLYADITYTLAAIGHTEQQRIALGSSGGLSG